MLDIFPSTSEERKRLYLETLLGKTDKVSKVSPLSVLSAHAYGVSKVAGKAEKDIFQALAQLFPDNSYGIRLDQIAENFGIAPRFGASGSSTYLRLVGDVGTLYSPGVHRFKGNEGYLFDLENSVTIGDAGFVYAKVRSVDSGLKVNVPPGSINVVTPSPTGHSYVINEYMATGGRDIESDDLFRKRIKEGANVLARGTLAMLEQVFMKINPNVLRLFYHGINEKGQTVIAIATQNGIDLNTIELGNLLELGSLYFGLTELKPFGNSRSYGVELKNIDWQTQDISFRCELYTGFNPDDVRKEAQIKVSKYLDYLKWKSGQKIEWDNLLDIVKSTKGMKYVPDQYFSPNTDVVVDKNKLPRVRGFLMLDLNGSVISSVTGFLTPTFYPKQADFSYSSTVLAGI